MLRLTAQGFLRVNRVCHQRLLILTRHLNTGRPTWKDAITPNRDKSEETQTLDLEKWKSVMRAQAAPEKKQASEEEETSDDNENLRDSGDGEKGISLLDGTRGLVAMWREAGKFVPQEMTDDEVRELAALTTKSSMKKYLKYLALKENIKRARKEKQKKKAAEREASMEQNRGQDSDAEEGDQTGPAKNTFLLKLWRSSMDRLQAWRSAQAMTFGQALVFDMSYEAEMSKPELDNTVSQLMEVEGWNRRATDPFHLHLCGLQPDGAYKEEFVKRYGAETWDRLLITTTDRQHVDMFPREQLVYLTADSRNVLRTFDHSKVYIIGALVDRCNKPGLSLANAKRLNLATARLPLDEFLHWEIGAKTLTLDQMIRILTTIRETGKWEEALKFVPTRKHGGFLQKEHTNNRVTFGSNNGPRNKGDRWLKSGDRTFKQEHRSCFESQKQPDFTGRERMYGLPSHKGKPAAKIAQASFKRGMDGRRIRGKTWWDNE